MKPIISFDLDMTLLDHHSWNIPDSALHTLELLRPNYTIVVASGRDMDSSYSIGFRDIVKPDAIIHQNGTKVTVGDKVIYEHHLDKQLLKDLLLFCKEKQYCIGGHIGEYDYYTAPDKLVAHDKLIFGVSDRNFVDSMELLSIDVRTLSLIGTKQDAIDIENNFPEFNLFLFAGSQGADVVERNVNKATGLRHLCDYFNMDITDAIAFGDSMNDYGIIKAAGTGVAMGNALPELKEAADYVTTAINEDGIYHACKHLGLI